MTAYIVSVGKICTAHLIGLALSFSAAPVAFAEKSFDHDFHDIQLSCPDASGGTLELIRANKFGQRDRVRIVYHGGVSIKLDVSTAEPGGDFEIYFTSVKPEAETDPDMKEFSEAILAKTGIVRRGVCLAPQNERERYFRVIDRQKKFLRPQ